MTADGRRALSVEGVQRDLDRGYARHVETGSRRRRLLWADIGICAVLIGLAVPVTLRSDEAGAGTSLDTVFLAACVLPLLLRHRAPLAASAAFAAGCVVSGIPTFDQFRLAAAIPAGMLVAYSVARAEERRRAAIGLGLVLAGMVFIGFTDVVLTDEGGAPAMIVFSFPLCIGTWAGGRMVRSRDLVAEQLAERSRMLEQRREQTAELAVEVERTRLASELDAAARERVREIIELAASGERDLSTDPGDARVLFAQIEAMGRQSLNEMRGVLGVLRSDERADLAPRPTLAQLEALLAEARRGGRLVELDVEGERRPLPSGVELAAYRVLQHALVAVRGDDAQPATSQLRYTPGALELEVQGLPAPGRGAEVALLAARERVAAHGGSFSSASEPRGARVLRAHLPIAVGA
jgi:signal transduction histidine kinase